MFWSNKFSILQFEGRLQGEEREWCGPAAGWEAEQHAGCGAWGQPSLQFLCCACREVNPQPKSLRCPRSVGPDIRRQKIQFLYRSKGLWLLAVVGLFLSECLPHQRG